MIASLDVPFRRVRRKCDFRNAPSFAPNPEFVKKKSVTAATSLGSRSAGGTGGAVWSRRAPRARV